MKQCRKDVWESQRSYNKSEDRIARIIDDAGFVNQATQRFEKLREEIGEADAKLKVEERDLAVRLAEARALASRWSQITKRNDSMLPQEREPRVELLTHPAGIVFLPPDNFCDSDSEGGFSVDDRVLSPQGRRRDEEVHFSEEEYYDEDDISPPYRRVLASGVPRGSMEAPPPPPPETGSSWQNNRTAVSQVPPLPGAGADDIEEDIYSEEDFATSSRSI